MNVKNGENIYAESFYWRERKEQKKKINIHEKDILLTFHDPNHFVCIHQTEKYKEEIKSEKLMLSLHR